MATLGALDAYALVHKPPPRLSEIKAVTLAYTLGHLVQTLAEVQVAKFKEARYDVKGFAMVEVLVYLLAGKKAATLGVMCRY